MTGTANNGLGAYAVVDSESTYYGEGVANHLQLGWHPDAVAKLAGWLSAP